MFTLERLLDIIVEDLRKRVDFDDDDQRDLALNALNLALLPYKKVKETFLEWKEMAGDTRGCSAILKSGPARGEECGRVIKNGGEFCSIHAAAKKRAEETVVNTPVAEPKPEQKIHTVKDQDLVIRPNRWKNFVYPGTSLILDKDKKVTAREGFTGEWLPLTEEDILTCKRFKLQYKIVDLEFDGEVC